MSRRYQQQAIDVALAAKLTLMYGKYYLAMLHTELFMNEENSSCQQAKQMADNISSTTPDV